MRSRLGPWLRQKHCLACARRCCAAARLASSLSWKKHLHGADLQELLPDAEKVRCRV